MKNKDAIEEIKTRLNNTTNGDWFYNGLPYDVGNNDPMIVTNNGTYIAQTVYDGQSNTEEHNINADTIFIANAKNDIEYLLQLVEDLTD